MSTAQPSRLRIGARFFFNVAIAPALFIGAGIVAIWLLRVVGII